MPKYKDNNKKKKKKLNKSEMTKKVLATLKMPEPNREPEEEVEA
jgi:hypothetical protein